jgi:hypothetical protein
MSKSSASEVAGVPEAVLDELAAALTEKIGVLLDRLTDRALSTPQAGTAAWRAHWLDRDSPAGRAGSARRLRIRAVLAHRAGISGPTDAFLVPSRHAPAPRARLRTRRTSIDTAQLATF